MKKYPITITVYVFFLIVAIVRVFNSTPMTKDEVEKLHQIIVSR